MNLKFTQYRDTTISGYVEFNKHTDGFNGLKKEELIMEYNAGDKVRVIQGGETEHVGTVEEQFKNGNYRVGNLTPPLDSGSTHNNYKGYKGGVINPTCYIIGLAKEEPHWVTLPEQKIEKICKIKELMDEGWKVKAGPEADRGSAVCCKDQGRYITLFEGKTINWNGNYSYNEKVWVYKDEPYMDSIEIDDQYTMEITGDSFDFIRKTDGAIVDAITIDIEDAKRINRALINWIKETEK